MTAEIPQSDALKEASEGGQNSLAEVMSRDPEGLADQDIEVIVASLRAQRGRIAQAEAAGVKVRGAGTANKVPLTTVADKPAGELGL